MSTSSALKRAAVRWLSSRPELHNWVRRGYCRMGLGTRTENDFLFALARKQSDIFFLNIGANDGVTNDPLYYFAKRYRWAGIALEPVPEVFEKLRATYQDNQKVLPVCAALSDRDGTVAFYRVNPGPGVPERCNRLGSFSRDVLLSSKHLFPEIEQHIIEQQVATITFYTLVAQCGISRIDVVSIDAEGYDYEILKQIDFRRFRPSLVIYEQLHLDEEMKAESKRMLEDFGYEVHNSYDWNFVAVAK